MSDQIPFEQAPEPGQPVAPEPVPVPVQAEEAEPKSEQSLANEIDDAVARYDAAQIERARGVIRVNKAQTPFALRDIDYRIWLAVLAFVLFLGWSLGGAPWHVHFWLMLGIFAFVGAPIVATSIFLWQRQR